MALLGLSGAFLLAGVVLFVFYARSMGDPAPPTAMPIVNLTDVPLTIITPGYGASGLSRRRGDELVAAEISPHDVGFTDGPCDLRELIARDPSGKEVVRHEPTRVCAPPFWVPWVINGP